MLTIPTPSAMEKLGGHLALVCPYPSVIHLVGQLGVGKTTLVRGFLHALGHSGAVKSPTYTLVEPYQTPKHKIYHFDFYRLLDPEELEYIGIRDYLQEQAFYLIEWPERGGAWTPQADIEIQLIHHGIERFLHINSYGHFDPSSIEVSIA